MGDMRMFGVGESETQETQGTTAEYSMLTGEALLAKNPQLSGLFTRFEEFIASLGDDVQKRVPNSYIAYRRNKNFAYALVLTQEKAILVTVKVDPDTVALEAGFTRDVRNIKHLGTGKLEILIKDENDLEKAKPLLAKSYENS